MKKRSSFSFILILIATLFLFGCQKNIHIDNNSSSLVPSNTNIDLNFNSEIEIDTGNNQQNGNNVNAPDDSKEDNKQSDEEKNNSSGKDNENSSDNNEDENNGNESSSKNDEDADVKDANTDEFSEEVTDAFIPYEEEVFVISEDGQYSSKEEVAYYIHLYGHLPSNYITKNEAKELGWESNKGNLWDVAPGKSIGGDKFGNREGLLPKDKNRQYYECDIDYAGGYRNEKRIIYSNDGFVFYTEDHYNSFDQIY